MQSAGRLGGTGDLTRSARQQYERSLLVKPRSALRRSSGVISAEDYWLLENKD